MEQEKPKPPYLTHNQTRPTVPFFHAVHGLTDPPAPVTSGGGNGGGDDARGGVRAFRKLAPVKPR